MTLTRQSDPEPVVSVADLHPQEVEIRFDGLVRCEAHGCEVLVEGGLCAFHRRLEARCD